MENGKEIELPEEVALDMSVSARDSKYVYEDVNNLTKKLSSINNIPGLDFKKYNEHITKLRMDTIDIIVTYENRVIKLQHKLEAIKFHMNNFIDHQNQIVKKYENHYENSRFEFKDLDAIFIYETEAFLFQTQCALDILAQIIALAMRDKGFDSYGLLLRKIKDSQLRNTVINQEFVKLINENMIWYDNFSSMRNLITHWGDLLNFEPLTHHAALTKNKARISYPKMPNGVNVKIYMINIWKSLETMIKELYLILIRIPN